MTTRPLAYFDRKVTNDVGERAKALAGNNRIRKERLVKFLMQTNKNTSDFIEQDPLTIDLKVHGVDKVKDISLDIVGIYSFATFAECSPANLSE